MPLVGRRHELTVLDAALDAAFSGRGATVVELVGEPGIGKTTLLGHAVATARRRGALVLEARCSEFERDVPFGLFAEALDPYLDGDGAADLTALDAEHRRHLATILPAAARTVEAAPAAAGRERHRLHRAVEALLARIAARRGLVLACDDIHWADPASVALLASLVRRRAVPRMLLAVAYRPHQTGSAVGDEFRHAAGEGLSERVALAPLADGEAEQLLPAALPEATRRRIRSESGGNPFHLRQLARAAAPSATAGPGASHAGDPSATGVPPAVREAIVGETRPLTPAARRMLEGAAITGDPFDVGLAGDVAELTERHAHTALDALVAADLVRATDDPRAFRFRHPLVRRTVYETSGAGRRLGAHARAAALLTAAGATPASLAHHVEQSARPGDVAAVDVLMRAGAEVLDSAPQTAVRWLTAARRVLGDADRDGRRAPLFSALAAALAGAGRFADSRAVLLEAQAALPEDDAGRLAMTVRCAVLDRLLGDHDGADARLAAALELLDDPGSPDGVTLRLELAAHASLRADFAALRAGAVQALRDATALGSPELCAVAMSALAMAEHCVGAFPAARERCREASELIVRLDDDALGRHLEMLLHLGWAEYFLGSFAEAEAHFARGTAVAGARGSAILSIELMVGEALSLAARGRIAEAIDVADAAVEDARVLPSPQSLVWALFAQTTVLEAGGDPALAVRAGEEAAALAAGLAPSSIVAGCGSALAAARVANGEGARAVAVLLELQGGADLPMFFPGQKAACYEVLTRAELLEGHHEAAAGWADRARASAQLGDLPLAHAMADRAEAHVALATGAPERAAELALAAACAAEALALPIETARSRILAGRALIDGGDRDGGAAQLREAEALLQACGSEYLRSDAVRELRRIGRRVNRMGRGGRPDARGAAALTAREREIAALVASGQTNRDVAAALFLSEKTVESHLANAFVKLGVSSRRSIAAALAH
ncbi:MAG: hypothetical protein QOC54_3075 [Baekduia sp.]|nr:hypothetical protein [Baekduia sp.]